MWRFNLLTSCCLLLLFSLSFAVDDDAHSLMQSTFATSSRSMNMSDFFDFDMPEAIRSRIKQAQESYDEFIDKNIHDGDIPLMDGVESFESATLVSGAMLLAEGLAVAVSGSNQGTREDMQEKAITGFVKIAEGAHKTICMLVEMLEKRWKPGKIFFAFRQICEWRIPNFKDYDSLLNEYDYESENPPVPEKLKPDQLQLVIEPLKLQVKDLLAQINAQKVNAGTPGAMGLALFSMKRANSGIDVLAPLRDPINWVRSNFTHEAGTFIDATREKNRRQMKQKGWTTHYTGEMLPPGWHKMWSHNAFVYTNNRNDELNKEVWYKELAQAENQPPGWKMRWNQNAWCYEYYAKAEYSCKPPNNL